MEYLIIRIRGNTQTRRNVETTLYNLGLQRTHSACLVPESRKKLIQTIKDYVAYGEITEAFAKEIKTLMTDNVVRLNSPVKGFGSIKTPYPKGSLGNWGKDIESLAKRMMSKPVEKQKKVKTTTKTTKKS